MLLNNSNPTRHQRNPTAPAVLSNALEDAGGHVRCLPTLSRFAKHLTCCVKGPELVGKSEVVVCKRLLRALQCLRTLTDAGTSS
jgi:hypothetical protein